jgi:hypothetical protein
LHPFSREIAAVSEEEAEIMNRAMKGVAAVVTVASTFAWASSSRAQATVVRPAPAPAPAAAETPEYEGPNRSLIGTGLLVFTAAYIPAAVVAGTSSHPGDEHMYVPVAGPWMNLNDRGRCTSVPACQTEMANRWAIGIDGVFQGIGAFAIVAGFFVPEEQTATVRSAHNDKPSVHVAPARLGVGGYGITAFGRF